MLVLPQSTQGDNYDIPSVSLLLGIVCQQGIKWAFVVLNYILQSLPGPFLRAVNRRRRWTIKLEKQNSSSPLRRALRGRVNPKHGGCSRGSQGDMRGVWLGARRCGGTLGTRGPRCLPWTTPPPSGRSGRYRGGAQGAAAVVRPAAGQGISSHRGEASARGRRAERSAGGGRQRRRSSARRG